MAEFKKLQKKGLILVIMFSMITWLVLQSEIVELTEDKRRQQHDIALKKASQSEQDWNIKNWDKKEMERSINTSHSMQDPPEQLAERIQEKCRSYLKTVPRTSVMFPITTNTNYNLLFCPMCKLASTYWTKFFKMLEVYNEDTNINSPYDIPLSLAKPTRQRLHLTRGVSRTKYDSYYKFMFVRDPYARILSAYVDKLFAPNPTFWRSVCSSVIRLVREKSKPRTKCGSDLTFEEYIHAIIHSHRKPAESGMTDCHDASFIGSCHPCELKMDFIGKMEQLSSDANFLYQKLNLNRTIETLNMNGKQLADEDALFDTVTSPFSWKNDIKSCVPWFEALKKIWRKLQIRGVIGKEQLPLTEEQADKISQQDFLNLIKKTQEKTSYSERKKQRNEALIEIYSQVNMDYLNQLKYAYRNDFDFFEYNDKPQNIFNISRKDIKYYGYLDL